MATGHFPTESHNFASNGHVNINGMTTVTLQTKYDPTLPSGYPKVAYPVEMSSGSGIYSDAVSHLPAAQPPPAKRPADHVDVVYRDVIAGSRESRGHHYDAPFIYRILKSLLPRNNTFFIATASVVKDALDTTDMRDWENNGTICDSTCAARCRPLLSSSSSLLSCVHRPMASLSSDSDVMHYALWRHINSIVSRYRTWYHSCWESLTQFTAL